MPVHARHRLHGFTLVEMAVVLLVVALILGSILVPLSAQVQQRNVSETQRALEETRQALLGYAMIHGYLPQPAKSASNGAERDLTDAGTFPLCTPAQPVNCTGFVPWATLGTPRGDAWGKLIRYSVNPNYAGSGTGVSIPAGQFGSAANALNVRSRLPVGGDFELAANVPAVLVSHGARNWGTTTEGNPVSDHPVTSPSNANDDEDANALKGATITTFWSRSPSDNATSPGGEFDDIVVWIPPAVLFSQLVAAGKLP
jgi:prepilin-type N-terminal cleavage/methylation domain-containing protein